MNSRIVVFVGVLALVAGGVLYFRPSLPETPTPSGPAAGSPATGQPDERPADAAAPGTDDVATPAWAVDRDRLMAGLEALAHDSMEGRGTGTPGAARARSFLIREMESIGLEPLGADWEHTFTWDGGGPGVNLVARIPGKEERRGTIVLTAHYDHLGDEDGTVFNGADDNASGTIALLELGRILAADPLGHELVIALLDAEEVGLQGARAFVSNETVPLDEIHLNVNLDMVARSGGTLWAGGAHHTPALRPILERVASMAPTLRLGHDRPNAPEGDDWTNSSDHGPFHEAGIPFVYFGVEDHPDYHAPTDDVDNVVPDEYLSSVRTILMALRTIDAALPLPPTQ